MVYQVNADLSGILEKPKAKLTFEVRMNRLSPVVCVAIKFAKRDIGIDFMRSSPFRVLLIGCRVRAV
jgi:hypothetical protein